MAQQPLQEAKCQFCRAEPLSGWCQQCGAEPKTAEVVPRSEAEALAETLKEIRDACDGDPIAMTAANALVIYRARHPKETP